MNDFGKFVRKNKLGRVLEEYSLKNFNTYKVAAKARYIVYPHNVEKLKIILNYIKEKKLKYKILGNGSNVIFYDSYYDGIIIKLDLLDHLEIHGRKITVGSGYSLIKLSLKTAKMALTGLEFASGIPGTVGGAVVMNAGAYKSDMGYVVEKVKVLTPDLQEKTLYNKDLDYHYRTSFLKKNPEYIVLEATIVLKKGTKEAIMELIQSRKEKRLSSQPLEYPSAGSVFRNPQDMFAGELIEKCGLKKKNINGAEVSDKHANFIINKGNCTGKDIVDLIHIVQEKVKEKYQVDLILEQEIVK